MVADPEPNGEDSCLTLWLGLDSLSFSHIILPLLQPADCDRFTTLFWQAREIQEAPIQMENIRFFLSFHEGVARAIGCVILPERQIMLYWRYHKLLRLLKLNFPQIWLE